jgi:hypothetical protein
MDGSNTTATRAVERSWHETHNCAHVPRGVFLLAAGARFFELCNQNRRDTCESGVRKNQRQGRVEVGTAHHVGGTVEVLKCGSDEG